MRFKITKEKDDVNAFAVCLTGVPPFPIEPDNIAEVVRTPLLAVIGAVLDNDGWSFTNLSRDEKHTIGDLMLEQEASIDEWWWCRQYNE